MSVFDKEWNRSMDLRTFRDLINTSTVLRIQELGHEAQKLIHEAVMGSRF